MSESPSILQSPTVPPPAPPLPPPRLGPLQRFIAPLGLAKSTRSATDHSSDRPRSQTRPLTRPSYGSINSPSTVHHRTGIPIAAIDINRSKTHAILAGRDILKIVRVADGKATEDINLRTSIQSYASSQGSPQGDSAKRRRDYLPARDVKWSTGELSPHLIATAAANGRISLYDVNAAGSRIELAWLHEHTAQVNKIDIDPFAGRYLLSASQDKTVKLWDIRDPRAAKAKSRFDVRSGVRHVCWSPKDGNDFDFAICADGGLVQNWDARNPLGPKVSIHAHDKGCYSVDWHPDGRHVVSGGFDKYVKTWDFKSDNRRQKPTFQFRVPQAVRSVTWRPANDSSQPGTWQTSQVATTYHHDDARIHVWDLKRPHLPWLELGTTTRPATDFLWASTDLLWTAGEEGVFTQYDVSALPQVSDTISPSALLWLPGGDSAMFMEERLDSGIVFDPTELLAMPKDKLSGTDDRDRIREDGEESEPSHRTSVAASVRHRQNRESSFRSDTSRTNSPPDRRHIQQLDKTVHAGRILLQNHQVGAIGRVPNAPENTDVASFLANNYAPIATVKDRRQSPEKILLRLKEAFMRNADASEDTALYRQAQSWRMLAAVIVPELQDWAETNRISRRREVERRRSQRKLERPSASEASPSFAKMSARDRTSKIEPRDNKIMSNLFKGLKEPGRPENDSSSGMTTPIARPLPDSPRRTPRHHQSKDSNSSLTVADDLPALPPSLLNSHATAAAASRALHYKNEEESVSPRSSPERPRSRQVKSPNFGDVLLSPKHVVTPSEPLPRASPYIQAQKHEQKRNALRDYRAQARPIFSLDTQAPVPDYTRNSQHDSAESFPMFSASTSSSHRARSIGPLIESQTVNQEPQRQDSWLSREDSLDSPSTTAWRSSGQARNSMRDFSMGSDIPQFNMDDTPDLKPEGAQDSRNEHGADTPRSLSEQAAMSCSPDLFHFEVGQSPAKLKIHTINPALQPAVEITKLSAKVAITTVRQLNDEEIANELLIYEDFRPIDLSLYQPKTPFAWSAFPLLCQMIAHDVESGVACGQFATHLLLHISPYFFAQVNTTATSSFPESLAERLMLPQFARRAIESILRKHLSFLSQIRQYVAFAALRRSCVELGYDKALFSNAPKPTERTISSHEPNAVASACCYCGTRTTKDSSGICTYCNKMQGLCPICERWRYPRQPKTEVISTKTSLSPVWLSCHSCGHGGHHACMTAWLSQQADLSNGICPTVGCTCDCGPGLIRKKRIDRQRRVAEESKLISGGTGATTVAKRDERKAGQSPAVDRAMAVMRAASREREAQSADERGGGGGQHRRSSARQSVAAASLSSATSAAGGGSGTAGMGANVGGFAGSSRKSVRLMAPGEEDG